MNKQCPRCQLVLLLSEFSPDKSKKDGLRSYCRGCQREVGRAARIKDQEKRKLDGRKSRKQEWLDRNPEKRKILRERQKEYEAANRPKIRLRDRSRYWDPERRIRRLAKMQEWREKNPDKVKSYKQRERHRLRLNGNGNMTDYMKILLKDPCSYCGETGGYLDHVIPSSFGGNEDCTNITGVCLSCNSSKGNKSLVEFLLMR